MKKLSILLIISSLALASSGLFAEEDESSMWDESFIGPKTKEQWRAENPEKAAKWDAKKGEMRQKLQEFRTTVDAVIANPETPSDLRNKLEDLKKHLEEKKEAIDRGDWKGMMEKMREHRQERIQKMKDLRASIKNAMKTANPELKDQLKKLDNQVEKAHKKMEKIGEKMVKRGEKKIKRGEQMIQRGEQMQN